MCNPVSTSLFTGGGSKMGWAQIDSASAPSALVIDTETTMGTDPQLTDGTVVLKLDFVNAADGDVFLIRAYEKLTGTGDTQIGKIIGTVAGVQTDRLWWSVPILHLFGGKMTIEQTDGTGRVVPFSIRAIT